MQRLSINAKFMTAKPTGVHRVAGQLVKQLASSAERLALLFPNTPRLVAPRNLENASADFPITRGGIFRGQIWEQVDLPRLTRNDLLLNLCNLGPMASSNAITMIHDAQTFITPQSYTWAFAKWYQNVLPVIGARHARILAVSDYSARQLVHYGVAPSSRISVIANGVDHLLQGAADPTIKDRFSLQDRNYVVGLSNLQVHKNVGLLLKAFSQEQLSNLKLVLVGRPGRSDFEAAGHLVPSNTLFVGSVSDAELRGLLESALCVAFPSTTEGFGLPPLEGMSLGCPAILAPCGALPEFGGEAALYAHPEKPAEWVEAISLLADNSSIWRDLSRSGRERANLYTWKRAGEKLIRAIEDVVDDRLRVVSPSLG